MRLVSGLDVRGFSIEGQAEDRDRGKGKGFDAKGAKGAKFRKGRQGVVWFGSMADDGKGGKKSGALGDLVKAESMIQLALVLPAACLIGGLGGAALDKHFHTGWMGVTGILLGAAAGFVQIYKTASRYMKRDQ